MRDLETIRLALTAAETGHLVFGTLQAQLPLQIVSKGRFEKSEPTIHHGENLDVPTFLRRGMPMN
jgi:hypothetical protein